MKSAFTEAADFSGMSEAEPLFASAVMHKAFVGLYEARTAINAVPIASSTVPVDPPESKVFTADHPFLFLIRQVETGAILLMGRATDPTKI